LFIKELVFELKALQKKKVYLSEDVQKAGKYCYAIMHTLDALTSELGKLKYRNKFNEVFN